jgi:N-methylhydantoinase A
MGFRIGVDVGGTFTDVVVFDEDSGLFRSVKSLSTPRDPWKGVIEGLEAARVDLRKASVLVHATTLGANMLLGQEGLERPRLLLITNRGFRDVLEIGRQNRPSLYDPFFSKPPPLVPRDRRIGVRSRIGSRGEIVEDLDVAEVARVARECWFSRTPSPGGQRYSP